MKNKLERKEVMMKTRPKKLVIHQLYGYEEKNLLDIPVELLCQEIYPLCWEFIEEMLDIVYSDGPICFKSYPFSDKNTFLIFSTFGNEITPTKDYDGPILFEEDILVRSNDFATFSSGRLEDYYDTLATKYSDKNLESLAVYHVLYHPGKEISVDAYSSWEVD